MSASPPLIFFEKIICRETMGIEDLAMYTNM